MLRFCKFEILAALLLLAVPAMCSDLAILHNGFSIRHERRETVGGAPRLYLGSDKGYIDIATDQIERFEKDLSPAVAPAALSASAPTVAAVVVPARMAKPQSLKPQDLNQVINTISDRHHIDPDFISSVIHAESGFNPRAVSPKGAQGLMQLMPGTASKLGITNSFDPRLRGTNRSRLQSQKDRPAQSCGGDHKKHSQAEGSDPGGCSPAGRAPGR